MLRFAANLTTLFTDLPFLERCRAAREAGFQEVEFLFPYDLPAATLARTLRENDLQPVLFNLSPGNWSGGERGLACIPGREADFMTSVELAAAYALELGCPLVHAMAGLPPSDVEPHRITTTYLDNIGRAADRLAREGLSLCLEPISRTTIPGYFLRTPQQAMSLLYTLNRPNLGLQLDCYHCALEAPPVLDTLRHCLPAVLHMQIAGVPDRHEPDHGTLDYAIVFEHLRQWHYSGAIGCEYFPEGDTLQGLHWLHAYMD